MLKFVKEVKGVDIFEDDTFPYSFSFDVTKSTRHLVCQLNIRKVRFNTLEMAEAFCEWTYKYFRKEG
jgi:hypothetical protein